MSCGKIWFTPSQPPRSGGDFTPIQQAVFCWRFKHQPFNKKISMNKLNSNELSQFTCTEKYYSSPYYRFVYTDGVKYVAQNGGCHWLLSLISLSQTEKKIHKNKHLQDIQFWTLTVKEDQSAKLICEQDEGILILEKTIPYTDFPLPKIKFYLSNMFLYWESEGERREGRTDKYGTLILPSEY